MVEYRPTSPWTVDRGQVAQLVEQRTEIRVSRVQSPSDHHSNAEALPFGALLRAGCCRGRPCTDASRKTSVRNTQMIAHRQHPRANYLKKRLYRNPDIPPGTRKHDEEGSHTTALRLCTRVLLLSGFSLRASYTGHR